MHALRTMSAMRRAVLGLALLAGCTGEAPVVRQCERDGCETRPVSVHSVELDLGIVQAAARRWRVFGFDVRDQADLVIEVVLDDSLPSNVSGRVSRRDDGTPYIRVRSDVSPLAVPAVITHEMGHVLVSSQHLPPEQSGIMDAQMDPVLFDTFSDDDNAFVCRIAGRCVEQLAGRVTGSVRQQRFLRGLDGASVVIEGEGMRDLETAHDQARYLSRWLPPGAYTVRCSSPFLVDAVAPVVLVPGITATIDCTLSDAAVARGGVVATDGTPIGGARVLDSSSTLIAISAADGSFRGNSFAGRFLEFRASADGFEPARDSFPMFAGVDNPVSFRLHPGGRVLGIVTDQGAPVPRAQITLTGAGRPYPLNAQSDERGAFDAGWTRAGSYRMDCRKDSMLRTTTVVVEVGATVTADCPLR